MTGPVCTPLDTGPGHLWCQSGLAYPAGLDWRQLVLAYLVALAVTWSSLALGSPLAAAEAIARRLRPARATERNS